jgi:hypothetical protein
VSAPKKTKPRPAGLTNRAIQVLLLFKHLSPDEREEFLRAVYAERLVSPRG